MTSCRTLRVASLILSNSSMQQTPPSDRTKAPLQDGRLRLSLASTDSLSQAASLPFQYELLGVGISGDVRRETYRRRSLSGSVDPSRSNLVDILQVKDE
jgi:hypothetical protein